MLRLANLLCLAGLIAMIWGLHLAWPPLAPLGGGALAVALGVTIVRASAKPKP